MNPYATHLASLECVSPADCVVEFGCGVHSTPFLLERCTSLMSVEQNDEAWIARVLEIVGEKKKWTPVFAPGPWAFMNVIFPPRIDLAFVDGMPATRWACVCLMMRLRVPIIVAHDTEFRQPYGWHHIKADGYSATVDKSKTPWTTTWRLL